MANNRPNWGAALQSLGQSLSGYAQQDYERKRLAYEQERERQQQLDDREYQAREWDRQRGVLSKEADARYALEHPMTTIPGRAVDVPAESLPSFGGGFSPELLGLPSGPMFSGPGQRQNENWSPAFSGLEGTQVSTGDFVNLVSDYNANQESFRQQQRRDAAAQAARLEQINATVAGRQTSDAAELQGKNSVWGDIPKDAFEAIVNAGVAKEEIDRMGSGFKSDVYKKLLEYAASGFTIDAAAEAQAEREVRAAYTPNYLSNGMELGYAPDVNGGELYYPSLTTYTPGRANTGTGPDWLYRDQKPSLDAKELTGATAENKLQTQPPTKERLAKELFAPDLEKGYVTVAQLKAYAKKLDVPWEQLSVWIPEAIAKADEQEKIGYAVSKRSIAQEQTGFVFNPADYQ